MLNTAFLLKILQDSIKSPGQMISNDYLWTRVPSSSKSSYSAFVETINTLEQQGWVQTQKAGRRTTLIMITAAGQEHLKKLEKDGSTPKLQLEKWALLLTIAGGLIAVLTCFPTMLSFWDNLQQRFRPVEDFLIIQSAVLAHNRDYEIIRPDADLQSFDSATQDIDDLRQQCMNGDPECEVLLVSESIEEPPRLRLQVTSNRSDQPLSISGLELVLREYREWPAAPTNHITRVVCGGGGGGYFPYVIRDLEPSSAGTLNAPFLFSTEKKPATSPQDLVGRTVKAQVVCETGSCDQFRYVTNQEVEGLELQMPFLQSLPSGWYEFQVKPSYFYADKEYVSAMEIVFDVIKPDVIRPWWVACEEEIMPGFADHDLRSNAAIPNIVMPPAQNPPAIMIINSVAALDNGYYSLDLQSGAFRHIGPYELAGPKLTRGLPVIPSAISSDGQIWATEVRKSDLDSSAGIGFLDLRQESFTNVAPMDLNENISPAISPSGAAILYITFVDDQETAELNVGEGDIYVYDINTQTSRRVTFTPAVIETEPVWVSEHLIAYLVPELSASGGAKPIEQAAAGLILHDLNTGEEKTFSLYADLGTDLEYLPTRAGLYVSNPNVDSRTLDDQQSFFIDPVSGAILPVQMPPAYFETGGICRLADGTAELFICQDKYYRTAQLFRRSESGFLKNFEQTGDRNYSIVTGTVVPNHLAVAAIDSGIVFEFDMEGNLLRTWNVPQLDRLLHFYSLLWEPPEFLIIPAETAVLDQPQNHIVSAEPFLLQEKIIDASKPEINVHVTLSIPWATGFDKAESFNSFVQSYVDNELNGTFQNITEPIEEPGGSMSIHYDITTSTIWNLDDHPALIFESPPPLTYGDMHMDAGHEVISVLFDNSGYFGGAHPGSTHSSLNFDLTTGSLLEMDDLFLPGAPYLNSIAEFCINDLPKREQYLSMMGRGAARRPSSSALTICR